VDDADGLVLEMQRLSGEPDHTSWEAWTVLLVVVGIYWIVPLAFVILTFTKMNHFLNHITRSHVLKAEDPVESMVIKSIASRGSIGSHHRTSGLQHLPALSPGQTVSSRESRGTHNPDSMANEAPSVRTEFSEKGEPLSSAVGSSAVPLGTYGRQHLIVGSLERHAEAGGNGSPIPNSSNSEADFVTPDLTRPTVLSESATRGSDTPIGFGLPPEIATVETPDIRLELENEDFVKQNKGSTSYS